VSKPVPRLLAGRGDRLFAKIIDWIILTLPPLGAAFLVLRRSSEAPLTTVRFQLWLAALVFLVILQWTLLSLRGQTLGKMAMGVRIVLQENGNNPGFLHAVVLRIFVPFLIGAVPVLGALFLMVNVLSIFGEDRRCLHDRIAGTKVVQV
jgi:uncharacterized RDD family membrane protein YckC